MRVMDLIKSHCVDASVSKCMVLFAMCFVFIVPVCSVVLFRVLKLQSVLHTLCFIWVIEKQVTGERQTLHLGKVKHTLH